MLLDAESEAPGVAEVPPEQLVLLDLEAALKQLHGLLAPHGDVAGDLLVTPDAERPHRVPRCKTKTKAEAGKRTHPRQRKARNGAARPQHTLTLGEDGGLAAELLEHLGGAGETVTALPDGDVEDELLHLDLPHRVGLLLLGRLRNAAPVSVTCNRQDEEEEDGNGSTRMEWGRYHGGEETAGSSSPSPSAAADGGGDGRLEMKGVAARG